MASENRADLDLTIPAGPWIGASLERFEDTRVLTGNAVYLADLPLPAQAAHVWFVRSDRPHARVTAIDTSRARSLRGVLAVLTAADLDAEPLLDPTSYEPKTPQPILAGGLVRFEGEPVALIAAESPQVAEDAAALVDVAYEDLGTVLDVPSAIAPDAPVLHDFLGSNVLYRESQTFGDVGGAFASADRVFGRRFVTNRLSPSPLEARGCVAHFDASTSRLTLWSSTQGPDMLRLAIAKSLDMPSHRIRVIVPDVGGAFGAKIPTAPEDVAVCCASRLLGRPLRWVESRSEYFAAGTHAKQQVIELDVAVTSSGRILGMRGSFTGDSGAYSFNSVSALIEPQRAASMMTGAYDVGACAYDVIAVLTNKSPSAPYRGVGFTAAQIAREVLFDEIARELSMDPLDFRLANMIEDDAFPYECITGAVYDSGAYKEGLELAADLVGYQDLRREQTRLRAEGRYIGIGMSPFVELTGKGSEISTQTGWPFSSYDSATVTVDPTGKARVAVSVVAQGQGHETTMAQIAADALGISPMDVELVAGDTEAIPFGMGTWASRSTVIGGGAIALAARDVRDKLMEIASALLEANVDDLVLHDSRVEVVGSPAHGLRFAEVAAAAYWNRAIRDAVPEPHLSATRFYDPRPAYASGCLVAVVEVDPDTGEVQVLRFAAVEDCGKLVNPAILTGQMHGAVAQSIGAALSEGHRYGSDGRLMTTTFLDYSLPRANDVPSIDFVHQESPSPVTVGGMKGGAEGGMVSGPAAAVAAVADAIAPFGPNELELPLTPENVLRALRAGGQAPNRGLG
jgi:aerobic carbon-monoxide dehydrogenase large subunit